MLYISDLPKFKNFMALWNFNTGIDGKILKCAISWKRLIVERNGRKFAILGTTVHIGTILLMPSSLSLVWGHSVHFAEFPILRFSKHNSFNSFHQISTKLHTKYHNQGLITLLLTWRSGKSEKFYGTLKIFKTQDHMGLEISKSYSSYRFHLMSAKRNEDIGLLWCNTGCYFSCQSAKF